MEPIINICPNTNSPSLVCTTNSCLSNPFICSDQQCHYCKSEHRHCYFTKIQSVVQRIKAKHNKQKQIQDILQSTITAIEGIITYLNLQKRKLQSQKEENEKKRQEEISLLNKLIQNKISQLSHEITKRILNNLDTQRNFEIPADFKDVISHQLSLKSQKFLQLKMLNNQSISSQSLIHAFKLPATSEQIKTQRTRLKQILIQQGKIMTFWTLKFDNLKNITQDTQFEQVDFLKMINLKDWSLKKLQLIGRHLPNLKQLRIIECALQDSDAVIIANQKGFSNLSTLNLHGNRITGYGGIILASCFKNVVNLFLGGNPIENDAKQRIMQLIPKVQFVMPWTFNLKY